MSMSTVILTAALCIVSVVSLSIVQIRQQHDINIANIDIQNMKNELSENKVQIGDHAILTTDASMETEYNFPDTGGASADVVLTKGNQSISGIKTFNTRVVVASDSNPLKLGVGNNQLTINIGSSAAAARTYTISDVGDTADFVLSKGNMTIEGVKTFSDGISFNGVPTLPLTLHFFEQYNVALQITGPWAPTYIDIHFLRIGNQVTLFIPRHYGTSTVTNQNISTISNEVIPARFRSWNAGEYTLYFPMIVVDNGIREPGMFIINADPNNGGFTIERANNTPFASGLGQITGFEGCSFSYLVHVYSDD